MMQGMLTHAWTTAEASKPHGWHLLGVVRAASPLVAQHGLEEPEATWLALAQPAGDDGVSGILHGGGATPEQALYQLARRLVELRGDRNG
jgi:hypothetical protein